MSRNRSMEGGRRTMIEHKQSKFASSSNPKMNKMIQAFDELYHASKEAEFIRKSTKSRVQRSHPSSFGGKGNCMLLNCAQALGHGDVLETDESLMGQWYVEIGTVVHERLQVAMAYGADIRTERALGDEPSKKDLKRTKKSISDRAKQNKNIELHMTTSGYAKAEFVGDYICQNKECNHVHEFSTLPKECAKCGQYDAYGKFGMPFFYEELKVWHDSEFRAKLRKKDGDKAAGETTIIGHADGLLMLTDYEGTVTYIVVDYKTCGVGAVNNHKKTGDYFPYRSNTIQIKSYCALFELNRGIKIFGWMLVYVPRDNYYTPITVGEEVTEEEMVKLKDELDTIAKGWDMWRSLEGCKDKKEYKKVLNYLIGSKPCKSFHHYSETLKGSFFECELGESQVCFNPEKLKPALDDLARSKNFIKIKNL